MIEPSEEQQEINRLRLREERAADILEWWVNQARNVVGAPKQETLDWLAEIKPYPEEGL